MHEMGIATSVLEAVGKEVRRYPGRRAFKVGLRIGEFAGVDCESVRFCFEALIKSTEWEPLALEIDWRLATSANDRADELDLTFVELEETGPAP